MVNFSTDGLVDLFFYQTEKQDSNTIFLEWLNPKNKVTYSWSDTTLNIYTKYKNLF